MRRIIAWCASHKLVVAFLVVVLGGGGYWVYQKQASEPLAARYVTSQVERGALTVTVSSAGQVSVLDQVDVKPQVSSTVTRVQVSPGDIVSAGSVVAQLDTRDAYKVIRDAEANLASAKLSLAKLVRPADTLSQMQAEHALAQAQESLVTAEYNLNKAYEDGFNTVASAFLDLPAVMAGLQDTIYGTSLSGGMSKWNKDFYVDSVKEFDSKAIAYGDDALAKYQSARAAYERTFAEYKVASRTSSVDVIENLITRTYETTKIVAEAVKSSTNLVQFYQDKLIERNLKPDSGATAYLTSLQSYTSKTSSQLLNLLSIEQAIASSKDGIVNAKRSISERTESLAELRAGADKIDIQSQELTVMQRENALIDARTALTDYTIKAPFGGVVAAVGVKVGDSIGSGTAVATIIAAQNFAEVTLNEIDVAKVQVGQQATVRFDALPDLQLTGKVFEVASLGSTSQGVVSYPVKISFDIQDERIKTGMTVSTDIITAIKTDALLVPSAAVRTRGDDSSYVEVMENGLPQVKIVTLGLSNDALTEIISGLSEGEVVVTQTVTSGGSSQIPTSTQRTQFGGGSAGGIRVPGLGGF